MGRVEKLEREVESLTPDELAEFRAWFAEFDWERWDSELEAEVWFWIGGHAEYDKMVGRRQVARATSAQEPTAYPELHRSIGHPQADERP